MKRLLEKIKSFFSFEREAPPGDVSVDGARLTFEGQTLEWSDVIEVSVRTTDTGPFIEDVFWLIKTEEEELYIPQGAKGFDDVLRVVQDFPGFDNEAFIRAMGCTSNCLFVCWERDNI